MGAARGGVAARASRTLRAASAASPTTCRDGFDAKLRDDPRAHAHRARRTSASCSSATASSATAWTASASSPRTTRSRTARPARSARSTGVAYDVRKDHPYLVYDRFDFDVPVGSVGDNFDRFAVRVEEMHAVDAHPRAGARADPGRARSCSTIRASSLPPKSEIYNTIEAMIAHFKMIMDGIKVPPGEVYSYTEGGNGELGFYIVSDGTGRPWKCRVRPPCFAIDRGAAEGAAGPVHRRHRADLRHDQHDRRGVRPLMADSDLPTTTASPARRRLVTVTIDGKPHQFPKGTKLLEACNAVGADIPFFCYHPGLSSPAVCRQCLVDVKGQPKLVPSCYTPVADKMEVMTESPRALDVRAADARVHAGQPPGRLPDLRQGGRVHAAEALLRLGREARAQRRHQGAQAQGRRRRPAHRARPGALHPVHALHPRLRRGRRRRTSSRWPSAAIARC